MGKQVRAFISKHRFQLKMIAAAIGVTRQRLHRRLVGATAWTAPEVVQFHGYLETEGVAVDLGELTRMCAADHGSE